MAIKWQGQNVISPFSLVKGFEYPPTEGFMFYPVDDENPIGWGKPFAVKKPVDEWADPAVPEYEDLPYGTPGGNDAIKHLYRTLDKRTDEYKWAWAKAPGDQLFGNVDWIGPYMLDKAGTRTGDTEKQRERISYNGPPMRYFAAHIDDFYYGTDSTHEEIYYQGRYLAIAPKPVLGACFRIDRVPDLDEDGNYQYDPITGERIEIDVKWLLAICKDGLEDVLYRKPYPAETLRKSGMDTATRASFKETKSDDNPSGWESIFRFPAIPGAYAPETPWFFNESGTEAVASRRFEDNFNNGQNDVTEDGFYLLKCYVEEMDSALIDLDYQANALGTWGEKLEFRNDTKKTHPPEYTDGGLYNADDDTTYTHQWQEDTIEVTSQLNGSLIIARDYVGDEEVVATAEFDKLRLSLQRFSVGNDPADKVDSLGHSISNNVLGYEYSGVQGGPGYDYPEGSVPTFDEHREYTGLNEIGGITMRWTHPTDGPQQFTIDQWLMGTKTNYDSDWLRDNAEEGTYVVKMTERFIHYIDIRDKVVLYMEQENEFFYNQADPDTHTTKKMYTRTAIEVASVLDAERPEENNFILREELEEFESATGYLHGFSYTHMLFGWRTTDTTFEDFTTTSWNGGWSQEDTGDPMKIHMGWEPAPIDAPAGTWPLINPRHNDWFGPEATEDYRQHIDYQKWTEPEYWHSALQYFDPLGTEIRIKTHYHEEELNNWLSLKNLLNTPRHNHRDFGIGRYTHIDEDLVETHWVFVSIMTKVEDKPDEPKNFLIMNLDAEGGEGKIEEVLPFGTKYYPIGVY